jgi:Zn-dependent peptidase ImmA (M78 family)
MIPDMNKVPWRTRLDISQETNHLLDRWSAFIGQKAKPPIPVEAIAENYLGIAVEYDNLEEMLGISDVLGATWVESKTMVINSSLLDGAEGRISFTCSHEIGHWVLHRKYFFEHFSRKDPSGVDPSPTVVCRISTSKLRGEWQADYFGACLLMPSTEVQEAFEGVFGKEPLALYNKKSCFGRRNSIVLDPALDTVKEIAGRVIDRGDFTNVSRESMGYRLHELGLLKNFTGETLPSYFKQAYHFYSSRQAKKELRKTKEIV